MTDLAFRGVKYTTLDRRDTFTFDFEYLQNAHTWRVYIVAAPPYGSRSTGQAATHRLLDHGRNHICWDTPIPTLDAAKAVTRAWSDGTQIYIRTGTFPPPGPDRPVPDLSPSARWPHSSHPGMPQVAPPTPARSAPQPAPHQPDPSNWLERMRNHWRTP